MRKITIDKPVHIDPFNEPASKLSVLNKPLSRWQDDLLSKYCTTDQIVEKFDDVALTGEETIVVSNNLWFDEAFLVDFLANARSKGKPARAAFRSEDPAFLQHGLSAITRSYEKRGELFFADLWYFPEGSKQVMRTVDPVIVSSNAHEVGYRHMPDYMSNATGKLSWWVPQRAVCVVDTWVHLHFINTIFGALSKAVAFELRAGDPSFRMRTRLRAFFERKPLLASSTYVQVGKNCSIDPGTVFHGPVVIGDNVTIGPGCVISQSIIGSNVTLAHDNHLHLCVIGSNCFFPWGASAYFSTFMDGASTTQQSAVEMSMIGRDSFLGAGTVIASFNLLPVPLRTVFNHQLVDLDIPVLGACVGHNCRVGAGLVIYPGRMIESDVVLIPSTARHVIMKNISYEESDHHYTRGAEIHPRYYPREYEQGDIDTEW